MGFQLPTSGFLNHQQWLSMYIYIFPIIIPSYIYYPLLMVYLYTPNEKNLRAWNTQPSCLPEGAVGLVGRGPPGSFR